MNDIVEQVMTYMIGVGYPTEDINEAVKDFTSDNVSDVYKHITAGMITKLKNDGMLFVEKLYNDYLTIIKETRDIRSYAEFKKMFFKDVKSELISAGYSEDTISKALADKEYANVEQAESLVQEYLSREAKRAETLKIQKQLEMEKDYVEDVSNYLHEKHVTVVHPRELADEFYSSLSEEEKQQYGHNPTYSVKCNLNDSRLATALSTCVEKFNHSRLVDSVIDEYITINYPDEENKALLIDKLSDNCPSMLRSEDKRANAYSAIIAMRTDTVKEDEIPEASASFAAKLLGGEPMRVAQDTCAKAAGTAKRAVEKFTKSTSGTVTEKVEEEQDKDEEFRKSVQRQLDAYRDTIVQLQQQVDNQQQRNNNRQYYDDRRYRNDDRRYYDDRRYPNDGYRQKPMHIPTWLIGVGANLILIFVISIIGNITKISIAVGQVGLVIATIGYPMLGRHKDAKRFLICGYGLFILWLLWSVLL